jgi:hypothetical protein
LNCWRPRESESCTKKRRGGRSGSCSEGKRRRRRRRSSARWLTRPGKADDADLDETGSRKRREARRREKSDVEREKRKKRRKRRGGLRQFASVDTPDFLTAVLDFYR